MKPNCALALLLRVQAVDVTSGRWGDGARWFTVWVWPLAGDGAPGADWSNGP